MPSVVWTPSITAAIVFAIVTSFLFVRARRRYLALPLLPLVKEGDAPPDCMVVIPARNEEGVVGAAVKSLPPDSVIVVDDHSTDATAEEAREAGAGVLDAPPLVAGASGNTSFGWTIASSGTISSTSREMARRLQ